jgi:hypothetical protein
MNKDVLAAGNRALSGLNGALLAGTISQRQHPAPVGRAPDFRTCD